MPFNTNKQYGVRYKVFAGKEGRLTTKEAWYSSESAREKGVEKIQNLDGFYEIDGYSDPQGAASVSESTPNNDIPDIGIRTYYARAYSHYHMQKNSKKLSYAAVEKKYGPEKTAALKAYHDRNCAGQIDETINDNSYMDAVTDAVVNILTTYYNGKAWFKAGSYAYLMDVTKPNVMRSSDDENIKIQSFAHGIDDYADQYVSDDFFSLVGNEEEFDQQLASEFFRPVKASPIMRDGGPKWGTEQERHGLDNLGLAEMASAGASGVGGIATGPVKNEGFADTIGRGAKYVKRGFQWWGDGKDPKETRDYVRTLSNNTLLSFYAADKKTPHTPADVQQRAIRLELKRRGIEAPTSPVRYNPPRANNTIASVGETTSAGAIAAGPAGNLFSKPQKRVTEAGDDSTSRIVDAVSSRIEKTNPSLLSRYGVEHVMAVIDDIAPFYSDFFDSEIGSSDISAIVKEVERTLEKAGTTESKKSLLPSIIEGRVSEPIITPDWHIIESLLKAKFEIVSVTKEVKGMVKIDESMVSAVKLDAKINTGEDITITLLRDVTNPNKIIATLGEDTATEPKWNWNDPVDLLAVRNTDRDALGRKFGKGAKQSILKRDIENSQGKHGPKGKLPESGIPAGEENKFHEKLDDLVHDTFGHSKKEKKVTEGPTWTKSVRSYSKGGPDDPAVKAAARSAQKAASRKTQRDEELSDSLMEPLEQDAVFAAISNSDMSTGQPDHFTSFKPVVINRAGTKVAAVRASVMAGIDFERDMGLGPDEAGTAEEIFHYLVYRDPKQPGRLIVTYSMV